MLSTGSSPERGRRRRREAGGEREEERGRRRRGGNRDNWIQAIRRKEGNSDIRREVDDGKTDAGRGGAAKGGDADGARRSIGGDREGYMAAAAAMATIGVVEQAGQLSY